jgi:AsmA protein
MTPAAITLSDLNFVVDDTNFEGEMAMASDAAGTISFDLTADTMNVGRYMEPADATAGSGGEAVPVEIPVDLIRAFAVRGNLALKEAWLSGMRFENVQLGLRLADGRLRMHPISADFFNGKYTGDVQINASGAVPELSVNENVNGVDLGALAQAMFDQENITGTINGTFQLRGGGEDLAAMQRDLSGNMSMELLDGALEGTDIWYELRRARALLKKEEPPEPELPPRTEFSTVRVTGPVTDGVFRSDDLFAELPFMQLTGKGSVDLPAAEIDYRLTARILERPEFAEGATEEELDEFTEAVIPMRVTGPLADPSIAPDVEGMLREEAEKQIKDVLMDKLFGEEETAEEKAERRRKKQEKRARKRAREEAQEAPEVQEEGD